MEGKDVYILLAFALLRRRRPVSPHRRSPCRFTGDHPAHHVDDALPGLTPSTANFPTKTIMVLSGRRYLPFQCCSNGWKMVELKHKVLHGALIHWQWHIKMLGRSFVSTMNSLILLTESMALLFYYIPLIESTTLTIIGKEMRRSGRI